MFNSKHEIADAAYKYRKAVREGKESVNAFYESVYENAVEKKSVDFRSVSIRTLFEEFVDDGKEAVRHMEPNYHASGRTWLQEAGQAVDTSAFSNIFGQLSYANFMAAYEQPSLIGKQLVTEVPAATQYSEVVPGVAIMKDLGTTLKTGEGEEFPSVGLSENYVTLPRKIKHGFTIEVTEETLWEDRGGLVTEAINRAAEVMAVNEEKELLDVCLGISTLYSRNGGAAQATYGNSHTNGDFDNLEASNALVDWTDVEKALLLLDGITDPETGEPILLGGPMQVVVPSALKMTAGIVFNASGYQQGNTGGTGPVVMYGNPLQGAGQAYEVLSNPYVKSRTSSADTWFIGNFRKAFRNSVVWPTQVIQLLADPRRDVVSGIRVRRKSRAGVYDPRYVVKCTA